MEPEPKSAAYSFVVADAEHDGNDRPGGGQNCDVSVRVGLADTWLSNTIPQLLSNPTFQSSGLLVVTTDESRNDDTHGGGKVATVLLGTGVKVGFQGAERMTIAASWASA